nr:proto-oncogene Mas-like [Pogona vitticeps]
MATVKMAEANASSSSIATTALGKASLSKEMIMLLCIPIAVMGLIGNGIVICLFCYRHKNSRFFLYFQNIAFANIIVLIDVFVVFQRTYFHTVIKPFVVHLVEMLQTLGYNTRFYILTAVCVERCLIIFSRAWNKRYRPQHMAIMVCGTLWSLSCLTSVVDNLACSTDFITTYEQFAIDCKTASLISIIVDLAIFLPVTILSTFAILIRTQTQQVPSASLDVTIEAIVILYLLTDTPVRITHNIIYWFQEIDVFLLITITQLLDSINCAVNPLILVIVGYWKKTPEEPFSLLLEKALEAEENMAPRTEADEEPA